MRLTALSPNALDAQWRDEVEDYIDRWTESNPFNLEAEVDFTGRSGNDMVITVWDGGDKEAEFTAEPFDEFKAWWAEFEEAHTPRALQAA